MFDYKRVMMQWIRKFTELKDIDNLWKLRLPLLCFMQDKYNYQSNDSGVDFCGASLHD